MSYTCFNLSIDNAVAHIQLSRPEKRNSMTPTFWEELPAVIRDIDDNSKARVIVISSTGPVFCAGLDLAMFGTGLTDSQDKNSPTYGASFLLTVKYLQDCINAIEECRIPVIAAIQGGCIGGGVDLTATCDMRYGTADSYITIFEVNVGMTADIGTFPRIQNHLPEGIVRELAYTGRKMGAEECKQRGYYNEVYADQAAMLEGVMKIAADIASKPPLAVSGCKRIITYGRDHTTMETLDNIAVWNMSQLIPTEMMEAMQSRGQKRPGVFADLPKRKKG